MGSEGIHYRSEGSDPEDGNIKEIFLMNWSLCLLSCHVQYLDHDS